MPRSHSEVAKCAIFPLSNTVVQAIQDKKRRALLAMREDSMRYFLEPYNIVHTPLMP